jgi:hypothetical protein
VKFAIKTMEKKRYLAETSLGLKSRKRPLFTFHPTDMFRDGPWNPSGFFAISDEKKLSIGKSHFQNSKIYY